MDRFHLLLLSIDLHCCLKRRKMYEKEAEDGSFKKTLMQSLPWVWLLPVVVKRLRVGDLHAVRWGLDP